MPLRFFYRRRVSPWASINVSRSGPSLTVGPPGVHLTLGRRLRTTLGIPGTGVYWTQSYVYRSLGLGRALVRGIIAFVITLILLFAAATAIGSTLGAYLHPPTITSHR